MFVRWKTRKNTLYAYLCQSERKDGKPVSSTLGYLGSCAADATAEQQQAFWAQAETNLQSHNLSGADRTKIENAIAQKVPRSISDPKPYHPNSVPPPTNHPEQTKSSRQSSEVALLQAVIDNFMDGILILTDQGEWVQANEVARQICAQFPVDQSQPSKVPKEIWLVCQALLNSCVLAPSNTIMMEAEIKVEPATKLRVRVKWLNLRYDNHPCLLVMLEDRKQSVENTANTEVDKYGLTAREADVWFLYRANYTYKEIAAQLHISLNTVKKHMKNIHAKQETVLHMEDYRRAKPTSKSEPKVTYLRDRQSPNSLISRIASLFT